MLTSKSIRLQITINNSHLTQVKKNITVLDRSPEQLDRPEFEDSSEDEEENVLDDEGDNDEEDRDMWTIDEEDSEDYSEVHGCSSIKKSVAISFCGQEETLGQLSTIKANKENHSISITAHENSYDRQFDFHFDKIHEISTLNSANIENKLLTVVCLPDVEEWDENIGEEESESQNKKSKTDWTEIKNGEQYNKLDLRIKETEDEIINQEDIIVLSPFTHNLEISRSSFQTIDNLINAKYKNLTTLSSTGQEPLKSFQKTQKKGLNLSSKIYDTSTQLEQNKINERKPKIKLTKLESINEVNFLR